MIKYRLIYSNRKSIAINIDEKGRVLVKAPAGFPQQRIDEIVRQKEDWINRQKIRQRVRRENQRTFTEEEITDYRKKAEMILTERVHYYEPILGVKVNRIHIKDQKTRWGSCSSKKNVNLNWRLILAPQEVMDYVIIHELCHLIEMNHSRAFWELVESICPDYRERKQWLKENAGKLGR